MINPQFTKINVRYELPCDCKQVYIGETSQQLNNRITQQTNDIDVKYENTASTKQYHHKIEIDKVKVVNTEITKFNICISMNNRLSEEANDAKAQKTEIVNQLPKIIYNKKSIYIAAKKIYYNSVI